MSELLRLPLGRGGDLVRIRVSVRHAGELLGLGSQDQTRLATAAAEVARSTCATGGGTMRLFITPEPGSAGLLSVELQAPAGGSRDDHPATVAVLGRLVDRFDVQGRRWHLAKRLPGTEPLPPVRLAAARDALAHDREIDPVTVLHEQNTELASTLVELRSREAELVRLNAELEDTNRGVLALYAELERSAEQIRIAQRQVFTELESALRPPPPLLPGVELAIRYLPAQKNSPTGGDLYDWLVLPDGWLHLSVVDVVGHGVVSTRTALEVTHALRTLSREGRLLEEMVGLADALLDGTGSLATVLLARIRIADGDAEIAGGGHPPALLLGADGTADYLEASGRPIGFPGAGSSGVARVRLAPGDTLLLYTDGLIEAGNDLDDGMATIRAAGQSLAGATLDSVLDGVLETVRAQATLRDDTLLLGVRLTGDERAIP